MKIGDRVKGIYEGREYHGKISHILSPLSEWPMFFVEVDEPIRGLHQIGIFRDGDTIEIDVKISSKIKGLKSIKLGDLNE